MIGQHCIICEYPTIVDLLRLESEGLMVELNMVNIDGLKSSETLYMCDQCKEKQERGELDWNNLPPDGPLGRFLKTQEVTDAIQEANG